MMSTADKVVPFKGAPGTGEARSEHKITHLPGLHSNTLESLEASHPGMLSQEMRALLQKSCGLAVPGFVSLDFTGQCYPEEPISVLRPSLTLAIDDEGRRWIAETSHRGLPGPIWCVLDDPAVAVHVSDDLGAFLQELEDRVGHGNLARWLRSIHRAAHRVWTDRHTLARRSYELCQRDRLVSGWLAELPVDACIYDLRAPTTVPGWPYGLAGGDGRFYRCGRLPIFAVANAPRASRWRTHMSRIASAGEILWPAVVAAHAA